MDISLCVVDATVEIQNVVAAASAASSRDYAFMFGKLLGLGLLLVGRLFFG